jgi:hypothetical protein
MTNFIADLEVNAHMTRVKILFRFSVHSENLFQSVDQLLYCNGNQHTSRRENCLSPLYLCLRYLTNPENKNKLFCSSLT